MARIRPSAIVSGISGVIGGVEFAQGKNGGIAKARRRPRGVNTARWQDACANTQWFAGVWAAAGDAVKLAWQAYSSHLLIRNRWGRSVKGNAYQCALIWHMQIYDWLDRVSPGGVTLQYPQAITFHAPWAGLASASFTAGGAYNVTVVCAHDIYTREILYAGRGKYQRFTGASNMRFIGALAKAADTTDWAATFARPGCDWEFQAGEAVTMCVYHLGYGGVGWPNFAQWFSTVVL